MWGCDHVSLHVRVRVRVRVCVRVCACVLAYLRACGVETVLGGDKRERMRKYRRTPKTPLLPRTRAFVHSRVTVVMTAGAEIRERERERERERD